MSFSRLRLRFLYFFLGLAVGGPLANELRDRDQPDRPADWEQERERAKQFSRSTGETVDELSEATLNTLLQATEALKARMAAHRAWREEEHRLEEEERR
ncbi:hypothetical protein C8R43DRAFT_1008691 [Mycena crocata]|nr:hypothetical protein C8R43DRAFT_1008691 [Mycena crocata]